MHVKKIALSVYIVFGMAMVHQATAQIIPMTFRNGSIHSIPLVIPGVMNPNLSPMSNSGVSLEVGQKVYFFPNGKKSDKKILFIVEPNWKRDTVLRIDQIVDIRKKALN